MFCGKSRNHNNGGIECHVCNVSYRNYNSYFTHLIDTSCIKSQEEKRIGNTSMAIYSTQIGTRKPIQSTAYCPSNSRRLWKSEPTIGSKRIWKNYKMTKNSHSGTKDPTIKQQDAYVVISKSMSLSLSNENRNNFASFITIESDSDQEIQIIVKHHIIR